MGPPHSRDRGSWPTPAWTHRLPLWRHCAVPYKHPTGLKWSIPEFLIPRPQPRKLEPYVIVFHGAGGMWSDTAIPVSKFAPFEIDRIQELSISDETFQAPVDFDARSFMDQAFRGQPQVQVRLRFHCRSRQYRPHQPPFWESLEEQPDGSVVVTVSAPDMNWAASTILAYGPVVEVLDPPGLRRLLKEWAQEIFKIYSKEGD